MSSLSLMGDQPLCYECKVFLSDLYAIQRIKSMEPIPTWLGNGII